MPPRRDGFVGAAVGDGSEKDFYEVVSHFLDGRSSALKRTNLIHSRLNSKVSPRNVVVNDLVTDLSDGVYYLSLPPSLYGPRFKAFTHSIRLGNTHSLARDSRQRIPRSLCIKTKATRPALRECQCCA